MNNIKKGIYFSLMTSVISGVAIFVNKFAVTAISPPLIFTTVKNLGVGLLIVAIIIASRKWKLFSKLNKREIIYLLLIGIIGGTIPFYLYFTGLTQIPAINAAIIHKTLIIWVAIMAIPFLKERLSKLQILAVLMLFGANVFVGGFQGFTLMEGEFLVLIATVFWAIENVLAKKILPTVDPDIVTAARMGFGSLILLGASFIAAPGAVGSVFSLDSTQMMWMGITMVTLLGYVTTWYRALKFAPATLVTSILVSSALVTNALSAIFVTQKWTAEFGIQAVLIVAGVALFGYSAIRASSEKRVFQTA